LKKEKEDFVMKEKILAIIKESHLMAYLATCDGSKPDVRPIATVIEDDLTIWIATYTGSKKVKQIKANPNICLAFVTPPQGQNAANVYGTAEIIDNNLQKERIWNLSDFPMSTFFPNGPLAPEFTLLKIKADRIEWREGMKINEVFVP
jgi:general stress protein 26